MAKRRSRPTPAAVGRKGAGQIAGGTDVLTVYEELLRSRDRLAALSPASAVDLENIAQAMHEVIWYFITPPRTAKTTLQLASAIKARLLQAARNRHLDLYAQIIALVALKLSKPKRRDERLASRIDEMTEVLDEITFDYRRPKAEAIQLLGRLKSEVTNRVAYLRQLRAHSFKFNGPPERYSQRKDKKERPDQFFRRIYGAHLARGLTQADIRREDAAFYNVFHVWCSRHRKRMSSFVPGVRSQVR